MTLDHSLLRPQLRFWSIHCSINALPSFVIAMTYLGLWQKPAAILAMLLAVATFITGYTFLTSIRGLFGDPQSLLSRALKLGTKIRLVMSLITLLLIFPSPIALFLPDVWAGLLAAGIVNAVGQRLGNPMSSGVGGIVSDSPLAVFATTLLEGLILSFLLLMISFFCLLGMQIRSRRRGAEIPTP